MSGKWISRKVPAHKCNLPSGYEEASQANEGDLWRCECTQIWLVTKVRTGTDPRPGEGPYGWIEWEQYGGRYVE